MLLLLVELVVCSYLAGSSWLRHSCSPQSSSSSHSCAWHCVFSRVLELLSLPMQVEPHVLLAPC